MKRVLRPEQRCKSFCPDRWTGKAHQCPFSIKEKGLCGTHLRHLRDKEAKQLGRELDDRYRIRQLQAGYDELRTICNRMQDKLATLQRALREISKLDDRTANAAPHIARRALADEEPKA